MKLYDNCRSLGYCECGGCEVIYQKYRKTGLKGAQTLAEQFVSDEAYRQYRKDIGRKGGGAKYTGKRGFAAMTKEQRQEAGRKGGKSKKGRVKSE